MLDVEFLINPPSILDRPLIYRYRSGILRARVKKIVRVIAEQQGKELVQCSTAELPSYCVGGGLFPSMALCDLQAPSTGRSGPNEISALQALSHEHAEVAILFVEEGHPMLKEAAWSIAARSCVIVEEPEVTTSTVTPILEYLVRQSEFVRNPDLLAVREFRSHFDDFIAEHKRLDLPSFKQEFDRTVLLHVEPKTGEFLRSKAACKQQLGPNRIMQPLRGLVERADPSQLPELLHGLAVRFPSGRTGREIADELARHAQTLFKPGVGSQPTRRIRTGFRRHCAMPGGGTPRVNFWLWAAIVLAFTPRLFRIELQGARRRPVADLSLVTIDQMGREFLRRLPGEHGGDPLSGLWSELEEAVLRVRDEAEDERTAQGKLVQLLSAELRLSPTGTSNWVESLRKTLTGRVAPGETSNSLLVQPPVQRDPVRHRKPQSFADVIGHQVTVERLRRRLQRNESTPIILYGPEGVGKKTLGRLYAKGLLCEGDPAVNSAPCGSCEPCQRFDAGEVLDYIEFDAASPHAADYVRQNLLKNLQYASFSRHRMVLIANPDKSQALVDMCLKTLETRSDLTRFIFTVTNIRAMSDTGKSRCDIYRLGRLDEESAKSLGKRFLGASSLSMDERAIDLLVAEANGLPSRLLELSLTVSGSHATTVEQMRRILSLDWAPEAISIGHFLLAQPRAGEGVPELPRGWDCRNAVRRVRSVLAEIYRFYESRKVYRSAFLHLDGDAISELTKKLCVRATEMDVPFRDLWVEISLQWTSDHNDCPRAWRQTRGTLSKCEVQ
ncbi:MAG: hypothetical protein KIT82_04285 [Bradyrhizobium sp.]|nr:hypothetical protein [Bradyrhizobium sp.]